MLHTLFSRASYDSAVKHSGGKYSGVPWQTENRGDVLWVWLISVKESLRNGEIKNKSTTVPFKCLAWAKVNKGNVQIVSGHNNILVFYIAMKHAHLKQLLAMFHQL